MLALNFRSHDNLFASNLLCEILKTTTRYLGGYIITIYRQECGDRAHHISFEVRDDIPPPKMYDILHAIATSVQNYLTNFQDVIIVKDSYIGSSNSSPLTLSWG